MAWIMCTKKNPFCQLISQNIHSYYYSRKILKIFNDYSDIDFSRKFLIIAADFWHYQGVKNVIGITITHQTYRH